MIFSGHGAIDIISRTWCFWPAGTRIAQHPDRQQIIGRFSWNSSSYLILVKTSGHHNLLRFIHSWITSISGSQFRVRLYHIMSCCIINFFLLTNRPPLSHNRRGRNKRKIFHNLWSGGWWKWKTTSEKFSLW